MNVNVSIGDFSPLLRSPEYLFKGLSQTGVDGIELWIGIKSRWTPERYKKLSKKYGLPIISVHQPLWAMTGVYFDEGFFKVAQQLGVQYVTCHPLPGRYLAEVQMEEYFERLARIQKRTGIHILIENMPNQNRNRLLNLVAPMEGFAAPVSEIHKYVAPYGLNLTLDTDHLHVARPQDESWFDEVFPSIRNVHLSSFNGDERHLPLGMGKLDTSGFIQRLKEKHYSGLMTLEVCAPKSITMVSYEFDAIRRSVALCH